MAGGYDFDERSGGGRSIRDEDFNEEDVWAVVKESQENSPKVRKSKDHSSVSNPRLLPSASRMVPRANNPTREAKFLRQSAPVNIPDWSKIYRKKKGSYSHVFEDGDVDDDYNDVIVENNGDGNDDGDSSDDMVPPHEWIARKLARSQISSFSVCEGVGRTLKGRDLSQVRNAILTRTGFLE